RHRAALRPNSTLSWGKALADRPKPRTRTYIGLSRQKATRPTRRTQWHSSRTTEEIALNEAERHARGRKKSKERRRKRLRCAKPKAPQPRCRRTTNKPTRRRRTCPVSRRLSRAEIERPHPPQ